MITRTHGRSKKIAIRSAVGAPRHRLAQQFLVENRMLTFLGGMIRLALSVGELLGGMLYEVSPGDPVTVAFRAAKRVLGH